MNKLEFMYSFLSNGIQLSSRIAAIKYSFLKYISDMTVLCLTTDVIEKLFTLFSTISLNQRLVVKRLPVFVQNAVIYIQVLWGHFM